MPYDSARDGAAVVAWLRGQPQPKSRREIREGTGLTKKCVEAIVADLVRAGQVEQVGFGAPLMFQAVRARSWAPPAQKTVRGQGAPVGPAPSRGSQASVASSRPIRKSVAPVDNRPATTVRVEVAADEHNSWRLPSGWSRRPSGGDSPPALSLVPAEFRGAYGEG